MRHEGLADPKQILPLDGLPSFVSAASARHGAAFHRAIGAIGVDVERTCRAFHDFARDQPCTENLNPDVVVMKPVQDGN